MRQPHRILSVAICGLIVLCSAFRVDAEIDIRQELERAWDALLAEGMIEYAICTVLDKNTYRTYC